MDASAQQGEGGSPRKPKSMIKPLRPEDIWHPRVGAPRGNRNAMKPVAQLEKRIRALKARVRRAIKDIA